MNINNDTARGRGFRTAIQALIGLFVGLVLTVWAVPGVPEAVTSYITSNISVILGIVGISSASTGVVSWIWNLLRKDVVNK